MPEARIDTISYLIAGMGLLLVLILGLLPAFLAGLLIYHLVVLGAGRLGRIGVLPEMGRVILLVAIAAAIIFALSFGVAALVSHLAAGPESLSALLHKMADVVAKTRNDLPEWAQDYLPADVDQWQTAVSDGLRQNASQLNIVGKDALLFFTHVIFGMVIGGLVALQKPAQNKERPLTASLKRRMDRLALAFRRVVFSQIRISALNTALTAIFLFVLLPLMGVLMPLTKTLVAVTFVVGLLPVVGNLVSNTVIVLVALGVSPLAATSALIFLILIHKLEYFVNARIIGSQINARAAEMLVAMVVMDAAFGLPGLVAAPIFYAYLKDELAAHDLI